MKSLLRDVCIQAGVFACGAMPEVVKRALYLGGFYPLPQLPRLRRRLTWRGHPARGGRPERAEAQAGLKAVLAALHAEPGGVRGQKHLSACSRVLTLMWMRICMRAQPACEPAAPP